MANIPSIKLSVVINTKNSAETLEQALRSVEKLADEIIVMDMKSTDDTVKIAEKFGARTFSHPDVGYVEPARNAALAKATGNWILVLDADEEIPSLLAKFIRETLPETKADAFFLPRQNIIFGRAVKTGWWPDYILRLFRKGSVQWSDEIHAVPQVNGSIDRVNAQATLAITHHNYQTVDQFIDRAQRYAAIEAQQEENKDAKPDPAGAFFGELIQRYYGWEGCDDGMHGLMLSFLQGTQKVIEHAKLWEKQGFRKKNTLPSLSKVLAQAAADARYWEARRAWLTSSGVTKLYWKARMRWKV